MLHQQWPIKTGPSRKDNQEMGNPRLWTYFRVFANKYTSITSQSLINKQQFNNQPVVQWPHSISSLFMDYKCGGNRLKYIGFLIIYRFSQALKREEFVCILLSPIYTAENFWRGLDESGTCTKKIVLITHLHVLFSTVLNDVKLWFGTGKRLNISASVLDSCLVRMLLPL